MIKRFNHQNLNKGLEMTKKDIYLKAIAILAAHSVEADSALYKEVSDLLEPKAAGMKLNLEDFAVVNEDGKAVRITCRLSDVELPASKEFFYSDKNSKVECENGDLVYPHSLQAIKIKRDFDKAQKASADAITKDVMDEVISPARGKELLAELDANTPDYSSVTEFVETDAE